MDYARDHIRKYWGISYRRTIGIAFVTLAVALSIGMTFVTLTTLLALTSYYMYFVFWSVLLLITIVIFLANFMNSHIGSVSYMNEMEHKSHSKRMGIWMIVLVLGIVAFVLPLLFVGSYMEPLMLLLTFGGVLWMLYISIAVLFKHSYGELAIGGAIFWLMFALGLLEISRNFSTATKISFSLYFATMSITIIAGFIGLAMIINSSSDSFKEFTSTISDLRAVRRVPRRRQKKLKVR
ncbi:MAG: hypothetical protein ACREBH_01390 [Candidatus Micrarchaeaceae archaeon]